MDRGVARRTAGAGFHDHGANQIGFTRGRVAEVHGNSAVGNLRRQLIELGSDLIAPTRLAGTTAVHGTLYLLSHMVQQLASFQLQRVLGLVPKDSQQRPFVQGYLIAGIVHGVSSPAIFRAIRLSMPCSWEISSSVPTRSTIL